MKFSSIILLVSLLLLESGCIGIRNNKLPQVDKKDLQFFSAKKTKLFSSWNFDSQELPTESKSQSNQVQVSDAFKKRFNNFITNSGCCIMVSKPSAADVILEGEMYNDNNKNTVLTAALISPLTLYIIPSWIEAKHHMVIKAKSGNKFASYELQDSLTIVQWLPLIVALPFRDSPAKTANQMFDNAMNTLLLRIKNDGFISNTKSHSKHGK